MADKNGSMVDGKVDGKQFWYLDNPTHRKRELYSGPYEGKKLLLVMVGLPARGKSFMARKVEHYLNWIGFTARVFALDEKGCNTKETLEKLWDWICKEGQVGIYDGENASASDRKQLLSEANSRSIQAIFVEANCECPDLINANIRDAAKHSPEFAGMNEEDAIKEINRRIEYYRERFEPIDDDTMSYMKIIQHSEYDRKIITNRIKGYLPTKAVFFLSNIQFVPRHLFLSRHGESQDNVRGLIGGDSDLSERGRKYAVALADFIMKNKPENAKFKIWTSTLRRSIQTAEHFDLPKVQWKFLNEINAGICEGMTYKQIEEKYPEEFAARAKDKYYYRYPSGESYADIVQRLEPVIIELERQYDPVLVIAHQAILRVLYAYFSGKDPKECPHLDVPLHTVAQITPRAYGCEEQHFKLC